MNIIMLNHNDKEPLYIQLYRHFKTEIEQNLLKQGDRMPSIRELSKNLSVSKITVEKAYEQLASEGYITNCRRARYLISKYEGLAYRHAPVPPVPSPQPLYPDRGAALYDFASGEMDLDGFDFSLWKRYINKVFADKERLSGYGHVQGEEELRSEIVKYIRHSRGVHVLKEQIIIGAGVQNLLNMLCSLLKQEHPCIAFEEPGFKNGRRIFTDNSFAIVPLKMNQDGVDIDELEKSRAQLVYVSPSHQFPTGHIMPIGQRARLLKWAAETEGVIIEDDYDSEFRYFGRPIPALKALDTSDKVVYLGSFSKIIPPSIRISFMVLPNHLLAMYQKNSSLYNQAASTLEQLALAKFMADGHWERQIRRLRKLYGEKKLLLYQAIKNTMGTCVEIGETGSGIHTMFTVHASLSSTELVEKAFTAGCRVVSLQDYYFDTAAEKPPKIILYFSKVPADKLPEAVEKLKQAWFP